jgi:hypothetical protein
MAKNSFFVSGHKIAKSFIFEGAICNDAKVVGVIAKFPRFAVWAIVCQIFI